jgi:hypothetical protein
VNVRCFDDLEFDDMLLRNEVKSIISVNMFQDRQNDLIKKIQEELNNGRIRVN